LRARRSPADIAPFRDTSLDLPAGTPALVEIVFDTTEDTRVLRTAVLARAEGLGLWLAMPNARFGWAPIDTCA